MSILMECLQDESKEKIKYLHQVNLLRKEHNKISNSLKEAMTKLGKTVTRNVNKGLKRQGDKLISLKSELSEKDREVSVIDAKLATAIKNNNKYRYKFYNLKKKMKIKK